MSGDYWLYKDDENSPFAEIDLMIRPMAGESIWLRQGGLDYEVQITKIIHVCESEDDDARIEVHVEVEQVIDPDVNEEDDSYERCSNCHCTDIESIHGEQGRRSGWSTREVTM